MDEINLHFTGDFHAITSANNLCAALLDNHIQQGNEKNIDTRSIVFKRCVDMNDRVLRNVVVGLGSKTDGFVREDHFVITVASEIMAVLCLATDFKDLKRRLSRMVVAYDYDGNPVTANDIKAVGGMAALLKEAITQAEKIGASYHVGNVLSSDVFYNDSASANEGWQKMGVLCVEMEAAALYMNAARCGKNALAMFTVSDSIVTGEATTAEERQTSFTQMMEIALNTAVSLAG